MLDEQDCKRFEDLAKDVRAVQIQIVEINVGTQRDMKYIREALQSLKGAQEVTSGVLSALALSSSSIATLTIDTIKTKDNIDSIKSKVERHDTYFAVLIGFFVLLWTWVSGILTSFISGK